MTMVARSRARMLAALGGVAAAGFALATTAVAQVGPQTPAAVPEPEALSEDAGDE